MTAIRKVALYEPLFYLDVAAEKLPRALVTLGRIVKLGPPATQYLPTALAALAAQAAISREPAGPYASLRELIPATQYDLKVVSEMQSSLQAFGALQKVVLVVGGPAAQDICASHSPNCGIYCHEPLLWNSQA